MRHPTYADIHLKIDWSTDYSSHTERHYFQGINLCDDFFPGKIGKQLLNAPDGKWVCDTLPADEIVPPYQSSNILQIDTSKIQPAGDADNLVTLRRGRFYSRNIIAGYADMNSLDDFPLRVTEVGSNYFTVDLNHPLSNHQLQVCLQTIGERHNENEKHGKRRNDIVYELLMKGPGLQLPFSQGTDFYDKQSFSRIDEHDDSLLYQQANLEDTFDQVSGAQLVKLYRRYLSTGDRVMDMMCGAQSYLPQDIKLDATGIGLNEDELNANKQLGNYVVQDVNGQPKLPFRDNSFDAVVFTAAVEYLVDPHNSFRELVRITRPGGYIMVTFSDHWVAIKSIRLWSKLYAHERIGLVSDYFEKAGGTTNLHTESIQGLLRAKDNNRADNKLYADPIYAVIAQVAA